MSPRFRPLAPRQHDHAPFRNVDCLAEELEETLGRQTPGSARAATIEGELAGLRVRGSAPLKPRALAGSLDYRAGFLGGHLLGRLLREGQTLPPQALAFAVSYGRSLVEPGVEEMFALPAPDNAIGAHTVAWLQATEKSGPMNPELRRATFGWLREGLGVTISPQREAALEKRWQERESCRDPVASPQPALGTRQPLSSIRVVAGPAHGLAGHAGGDAPSLAFGLSDRAWQAARLRRHDASTNPLTDEELRGFLEMRVGDKSILSKAPVSVFAAVCGLARARDEGFPDDHPICVIDDCTGTWALHLVRDPTQPVVQVTEIYTGASASVPVGTLADLIDAFLARFAQEATRRIPDATGWGELEVLAQHLPRQFAR